MGIKEFAGVAKRGNCLCGVAILKHLPGLGALTPA
jgi:hypothetical protein